MQSNEQNLIIKRVNTCCSILFTLFTIIICISLTLLPTMYFIFSIIGLVNTPLSSQRKLCNESQIWIYSLTSLITMCDKIYLASLHDTKENTNDNADKYTKIIHTFCVLFTTITINLIMTCWGIREFYYVECVDNLKDTVLYKTAFGYCVCSICSTCILFVILFGTIIVLIVDSIKHMNKTETPSVITVI